MLSASVTNGEAMRALLADVEEVTQQLRAVQHAQHTERVRLDEVLYARGAALPNPSPSPRRLAPVATSSLQAAREEHAARCTMAETGDPRGGWRGGGGACPGPTEPPSYL
jgi:hypothetical protein